MLENNNLAPINEWINEHEELIRFTYRDYKVWKEAKQPFHLGIQLKTKSKTWTANSPYYDYGSIQKIKITFQNSLYLRPYKDNCDIIWWVRRNNVHIIDVNKLRKENQIYLEDNFGQIFTTEQVNNAAIQILDLNEKINFPHTKSFHKYNLSYYQTKKHAPGWVFEITYDDNGFHAQHIEWKHYSKTHKNIKNIQLKRNGEKFKKLINNEKVRKDGKNLKIWKFYSEDYNLTMRGWLSTYLNQKNIIDYLSSVFSVTVPNCNLVNNSSNINIGSTNKNSINKDNYYLQSNSYETVTENKNGKPKKDLYIQNIATFEECIVFGYRNNEKLITKEEYDLFINDFTTENINEVTTEDTNEDAKYINEVTTTPYRKYIYGSVFKDINEVIPKDTDKEYQEYLKYAKPLGEDALNYEEYIEYQEEKNKRKTA